MPAFIERTDEFFQVVRQVQQRPSTNSSNSRAAKKPSASEFARAAGIVSRRVEMTASKLGQLTRMVKSSSMFNDSGNDINR